MNGIVLWSCPETWQAIIWCEDHADLVLARSEACFVAGATFPEEGDLIACELEAGGRRARAVRVLLRGAIPNAATLLHGEEPQVYEKTAEKSAHGAVAEARPETLSETRPVPHLSVVAPAPGRRPRLAAASKRPAPVLHLAVAS